MNQSLFTGIGRYWKREVRCYNCRDACVHAIWITEEVKCQINRSANIRVTHISVSKIIIIGSDDGLLPERCQAIIWTNAGILLIWPLWTNFGEILIEIHAFSFKKIHFKKSSGKRQPFCLFFFFFLSHPSNFKVTRAEKSTNLIQFE